MRTVAIMLLAGAISFSFTACDDVSVPPPGLPYSNTPAEVLEQVEDSFLARGITDLEGLLTADFVFYFDDSDVGMPVGDYTIPESWTSADSLNAVRKVFSGAHSIDISIETSNVGDPGPDDTTYTAENVQMQFLVMVDVIVGYSAQGFATFDLEAAHNEKNEKEWRVTAWRDFTSSVESGDRFITPASFGEILARYYKP
jgi:hypothetical protein